MTVLGVDYAWGRPQPVHIAAAGYRFVMRYLSNDSGKNLTTSEAKALLAAGLDIGVVWETTANRAMSGAPGGAADGSRAKAQADMAGAPAGSAIYFAVDFDAQPNQMPTIDAYANAFAKAIAPHPVGVYGGLAICNRFLRLPYRWQTAAWSHGWRADGVCLYQRIGQALIDGVGCDVNEQLAPFGGWRSQPAPPAPSPAPLPPPIHFGDAMTRNPYQIPVGANGKGWVQSDFDYLRVHSILVQGPFQNEDKSIPTVGFQDHEGKAHIAIEGAPPAAKDPYLFPLVVWTVD